MKNIFLCGFMGCGKTTISKKISEKTKIKFLDTDSEIEKKQNLSIDEIFKIHSERYFRKLETNFLKNLNPSPPLIISTGGGIFSKRKNIKLAKKNGIIVFLNCPLELCLKRIKNKKNRPLLKKSEKKIKTLFKKRQKKYSKIANLIIDNLNTVEDCTNAIIKKLNLLPPTRPK